MPDLSDKESQSDQMRDQKPNPDGTNIKVCVDCGTSKTPLWRGGPAGPKSLCNACGIKSRKKRRELSAAIKEDKKPKKSKSTQNGSGRICNSSGGDDSTSKIKFSLKNKLWEFDRDLVLQRPRSSTNQRRKLGEEEQAAILLMALSCGFIDTKLY